MGRTNLILLCMMSLYVAAGFAMSVSYGFGFVIAPFGNIWFSTLIALFATIVFFVWCLARDRPSSPFRYVPTWLSRYKVPQRFVAMFPAIVLVGIMLAAFGSLKSAIPLLQPFVFDPPLADFDEAIHGGPAWQLLQPIVGYPLVTYLLSVVYACWYPAFYASTVVAGGWLERPDLGRRYLISFFLCWVLIGNVGGTLAASVGPCFYDDFYASDRFAPLMSYLEQVNTRYELGTLGVQQWLLDNYASGRYGLGRGISAMPSVHVSIAVLIAIFSWHISKVAGVVASIFAFLILIGSVHLGYHYAIDGYVSIILTYFIWVFAGWKPRLRPRMVPAASQI